MMKTHRVAAWTAIGLIVVAVAACESNKPAAEGAKPTVDSAQPAAGTKHAPPIQKDEVPDGHWYCDMGTVHYSQPEQGNGTCPLCKMKLVKK
jgi:hypothetical protein